MICRFAFMHYKFLIFNWCFMLVCIFSLMLLNSSFFPKFLFKRAHHMHLLSSNTLTGECENQSKVFFKWRCQVAQISSIGFIFNKVTQTFWTFFLLKTISSFMSFFIKHPEWHHLQAYIWYSNITWLMNFQCWNYDSPPLPFLLKSTPCIMFIMPCSTLFYTALQNNKMHPLP